jgi:hypothetical protein
VVTRKKGTHASRVLTGILTQAADTLLAPKPLYLVWGCPCASRGSFSKRWNSDGESERSRKANPDLTAGRTKDSVRKCNQSCFAHRIAYMLRVRQWKSLAGLEGI